MTKSYNHLEKKERDEQEVFIEWICLQNPWLRNHTIKIMNEVKCTPFVGNKLNKQGRLIGACDLFIAWPTNEYYGLWIEMKTKTGRVSTDQKIFIERMNKTGYFACICRGADEAIEVLKAYLTNRL